MIKMSFSTWSIRNPIPPILLFIILVLAGIVAFRTMPVSNMPNVVIPVITITVTQPGAAPVEMETQITRKVENALSEVEGIKHISSEITHGVSQTFIEFYLEVDLDRAFIDTRSAISNIRDSLPRSIEEPLVQRLKAQGGIDAIYTVIAPESSVEDISYHIDDTIARELLSLRGVAQVTRLGGLDREITVALDPDKLAAFGVSASEISRQLAKTHTDMPGGRLLVGDTEFTLRTLANTATVEQLGQLEISLANGSHLRLEQVAELSDGGGEVRSLSRLDGKPVVSFAISRAKGASEVAVIDLVDQRLEQLAKQNPAVQFQQIFSMADYTRKTFKSTIYTFLEGTLLTVLVVFLFLRESRATLIAAITIPLSVLPAFAVMDLLGFSLNALSMLGIALVTGVLVDDAIVEIENIYRHMGQGKRAYEAALVAADEIGLAVVATTSVICAVFIPVGFMPGIIGQFFREFGFTVAIAAFFSLVVARLITPMLCAYLLRDAPVLKGPPPTPEGLAPAQYGKVLLFYRRIVVWTLSHRLATLGIAAASIVFSFSMVPFLSPGFLPYEDYSQSRMTVELPYGASLEQTDAVASQVMRELKKREEVQYVLTSVSDSAGGKGGVNKASIDIRLVPPDQRKLDQRGFENDVLKDLVHIADAKISFARVDGSKDISIAFQGDDGELLAHTVQRVAREARAISGINNVSTTIPQYQPEIIIRPDFVQAAQLGVSTDQISDGLLVATIGDLETLLPKFTDGTRQVPIRVRMPKQNYTDVDVLRTMQVVNNQGNSVPLSAVAEFSFSSGPTRIERYDRQRKISLEGNLDGLSLGDAMDKIMNLPAVKDLPPGIKMQNTGDVEAMDELNAGFVFAICIGLLLVYAVQVLLYKDWLQPVTRMAALPLSIGGAFIMLLLTGTDLTLPAIIGILTLMGIADKNSILLVDYMLDKLHDGMPKNEAIIEGCMVRARPIIMTSLAMLAGMLPIAIGFTLDGSFRTPMAIAVIGGLVSSTLLSLVFVPVLFSYVRDFEGWLFPKLKKLTSTNDGTAHK